MMNLTVIILLFVLGLVLIIKGGDLFVDAASWIAEASGIPKFIIGATVVSFATTLPELLVSVIAAVNGKADMAVGNAVGSVTANMGLVMGISIVWLPAVLKRSTLAFKGTLMALSCALLLILTRGGSLRTMGAVLMLVIFLIFIFENVQDARLSVGTERSAGHKYEKKVVIKNVVKFVLGIVGIVVGARLLVNQGSELACRMGVSEAIISVTLVAIGTSLPELVTTITALVKKQASLSIGNIIGANIIDLTVILPICTLISGGSLSLSSQSMTLDMPVCLLICVFAVAPPLILGKFKRWQGAAMLCAYFAYMTVLCVWA